MLEDGDVNIVAPKRGNKSNVWRTAWNDHEALMKEACRYFSQHSYNATKLQFEGRLKAALGDQYSGFPPDGTLARWTKNLATAEQARRVQGVGRKSVRAAW